MFKKLLVKIILEQAIVFEERAYNFYQSALSRAVIKESEDLFKRLLVAELKHRMKLYELQKRRDLGKLEVMEMTEAGGIQEISSDWPQLHPWSTKDEILRIALQKETNAFKFYKKLADHARLDAVSDIFDVLANEEAQHISWIQEEIGGNEK